MPSSKSLSIANTSAQLHVWILQILGLAIAYFITGKFGNFLAVPPNYATAVWPPAGIALAGILLYGYRVWPGILLGAFLINFFRISTADPSALNITSINIALITSGGAVMQAFFGAWLLQRFADFPNPLATERQVLRFMLFGGLLSPIVNSSLGVSALIASDRMPQAEFLANWGIWWIGDAIGILIFTPLVLVWLFRPKDYFAGRELQITLAIFFTFILVIALVRHENNVEKEHLKLQFDEDSTVIGLALDKSIAMHLNVLRSLESFYASSDRVDRNEFMSFASDLLQDIKGTRALEWAPVVPGAKRLEFVAKMRQDGFAGFHIIELNTDQKMEPASERPTFIPVIYIEPLSGNETAVGYDLYSNEIRREAIDKARDSGEIAATSRIKLVQERSDEFGILTFMPIYRNGVSHITAEERRSTISGYVLAAFNCRDIIMTAINQSSLGKFHFRLIDENAPSGEQVLFANDSSQSNSNTFSENGLFGINISLSGNSAFSFGDRRWRLNISPRPSYFAHHRFNNTSLFLLIGLSLTCLVGAFGMVSSGRTSILRQMVKDRTAELAQNEKRFRSTFEAAPVGVTNVALDGHFLEVNQSYCELLGYTRDELLGMTFIQITAPEYQAFDAEMIAKTLAGEISGFNLENQYIRKNGERVWGNLSLTLTRNEKSEPDHFVAVVENINRRKQAEALLLESEKRFQNVANAAPVLIWLADIDKLCIWFNQVWFDFTGRSMQQECGKGWAEGIHPNDLPHCLEIYENHFNRREAFNREYRLKRYDGEYRWVHDNGAPRFDINGCFLGYIGSCTDITDRKKAEQKIAAQNLRYRTLLKSSVDGIHIVDMDGDIVDANEAFCHGLGYSLEEGLLLNVRQWDAQWQEDELIRALRELIQSNKEKRFETKHRRKDGSIFDVEINSVPIVMDGSPVLFASARDISERKKLDEALRANEQKLRNLYELSPIGIALVDMDGRFVEFNESFRKITGYTNQELMPLDYWQLTPRHYEALEKTQLKLLSETGRYGPYEKEYIRKDGQLVPLRLNGMIVKGTDAKDYIWSIVEDITERKKTEATILHAKEQAENLARSKSEFLANMSHEIRTPMNAIIGLSRLALNKALSDDVRDYLEKINNSSESLLGILNDILVFSKMEAGKLYIDAMPFNLVTLLGNLHNLFSDRAEEKHLGFSIEAAADIPTELVGDALRIQQILSNLLGNAIKFTPKGRVNLKLQRLESEKSEAWIRFSVIDTGIGISQENQVKLFKPFSQVDSSITRRFGGTGLGLAISHHLLELMGSDFRIDSTPDQGTTIRFDLRLGTATPELHGIIRQDLNARQAHALSANLREMSQSLSGARILVAEDNTINQQVVREFLELSGITADIANNGLEALLLLERNSYNAILMDIHMPEMGGVEATEHIRNQPQYALLPIIALTAGVTPEERENCLAIGMNDFIAKPVNPEQLISVLKQWIDNSHITEE